MDSSVDGAGTGHHLTTHTLREEFPPPPFFLLSPVTLTVSVSPRPGWHGAGGMVTMAMMAAGTAPAPEDRMQDMQEEATDLLRQSLYVHAPPPLPDTTIAPLSPCP